MNIPQIAQAADILGLARLGHNVLTVGAGGQFATIAAALDYIGAQSSFITNTGITATATAWAQNTSDISLSASNSPSDPNVRTWLQLPGDTYKYPMQGSTNTIIGSGAHFYPGINRIEASFSGSAAVSFFTEKNWTIVVLDPIYSETIDCGSLAAEMSVTITSLGRSLLDLAQSGSMTWVSGRLRYENVILAKDPCFTGVGPNTVVFEGDNFELSSSQADMFSPSKYFGAVNLINSKFSCFYNSTRGHIFNIICGGDQVYKNIEWNVYNSAGISHVTSNAYFIDRFRARHVILDNVSGYLHDPNADFQAAVMVGEGTASTPNIGADTQFDSLHVNGCTLNLIDSVTATGDLALICLAGSATSQQGPLSAGLTSNYVDVNDSCVIAPRGTSTRKLVKAGSNPPNPCTVNYGANPLGQPMDAQANITYTAMT